MMSKSILVTGGAGFIGSNFVHHWLARESTPVLNLDKLTYAGNLGNLSALEKDDRHLFVHGDICDRGLVLTLLRSHRPWAIVHFAAETHVDRSIREASDFVRTNVEGTLSLLQASREYLEELSSSEKSQFRFLNVSTDEVYGSLAPDDPAFTEKTAYSPNSPYSASKAAADHLVRAFHHTYQLPALTTNCSNNYGPYQFPEKLIPLTIINAIQGKHLPVYGDGKNVRDWLFVSDHCEGIRQVLHGGMPGGTYNIGGECQKTNLEVVSEICAILSELRPGVAYESLLQFVPDRPGHDRRYAIDIARIRREIGWSPEESFSSGLRKTIRWYLDHSDWVEGVTSGAYREWIKTHYHSSRQNIAHVR
jgi:dTDP-glucose 4,6-dehydratase